MSTELRDVQVLFQPFSIANFETLSLTQSWGDSYAPFSITANFAPRTSLDPSADDIGAVREQLATLISYLFRT